MTRESAEVSGYVANRVREILEQEQLLRFLPDAPEHRVHIEGLIEEGVSLAAASIPQRCIWDARVESAE